MAAYIAVYKVGNYWTGEEKTHAAVEGSGHDFHGQGTYYKSRCGQTGLEARSGSHRPFEGCVDQCRRCVRLIEKEQS